MAEIRIQERKRPVWPWILLILIILVAAVLLYLYLNRNDNDGDDINEIAPVDSIEYNQEDTTRGLGDFGMEQPLGDVEQFKSFTEYDTSEFSKDYVSKGLNLMSGAVYNVVNSKKHDDNELQTLTDTLTNTTRDITDTTGAAFSKKISKSFNKTYEVLRLLAEKEYPGQKKEISELQTAVRRYDFNKGYSLQEMEIKSFFRIAGSILSDMKNSAKAI